MNLCAYYLGQRSFRSKVIVYEHADTQTKGTFALPGPLTWSVIVVLIFLFKICTKPQRVVSPSQRRLLQQVTMTLKSTRKHDRAKNVIDSEQA